MSHKATAWAYAQPLRSGPKFVLVALADFADENASCYPGQQALAAMTGMSDRAVRTCLGMLEADGYISRQKRYRGDGPRTSDRYMLCLNRAASTALPEESAGSTEQEESSEPVQASAHDAQDRKLLPVDNRSTTGRIRPELPEESSREPLVREPPENSSKRSRRKTPAPETFVVTAALRQWAVANQITVDLATETESFLDYGRANGKRYSNWTAAWRGWMRRAQQWRAPTRSRDEWIEEA